MRSTPVSFPETKWIPNMESHPVTFYPARENSMLRAGSQRTESTERTYARLATPATVCSPLTHWWSGALRDLSPPPPASAVHGGAVPVRTNASRLR